MRSSGRTLVILTLLGAASAVRADDTRPSPSVSSAVLPEVRVTARRREEPLLDVPDSITVVGPMTLDNARITSVEDLALRVPNVSLVEAQQPGVSQLNIRGVCQAHNGEPPVAMVIDGVQLTHPYQITQALFDIERIEVLKGPQGAVYGRNAIGGAINITTRRPTNDLQAMVQGGVGSDSDYTAAATLSGPIVPDKLLFRVATDFRDFDGDVRSPNTPGHSTANALRERDARVMLIARPSPNASIDFRVARADTDSGGAWYAPVPPGSSGDAARAYLGDVPGRAMRTLTDASLKADVLFEGVQLTAVSAYSEVAAGLTGDVDFLPLDGSTGDQTLRSETWSQELRLASRSTGPLNWLAGLYYLNKHQRLDTQIFLRTDFLPLFGLPPSLSPLLIAATRSSDNDDAYAAFGQMSYRWPSNIELTLALRYDEDHRHQLDRSAPTPAIYEHTFDAVQPKVSLSWAPQRNHMLYATIGKGFRSGGFNPQARITRIYKAETSYSYELGFKGSMLDNRLAVTSAAFFTRIHDRQVYTLDVINSAQTISNPVPLARVHGFELDVAMRPVEALDLGMSLGVTKSRIEQYDPTVFAGLPVAGDFTGNQLPQTPELSYSAYTQYRLPLSRGFVLTPRAEVQGFGGDFFWEIDNARRRASQTFVNLRLTAEHAAWTVAAFLENALDEHYVLEYLPQEWSGVAAGDIAAAGRGRHWGIEARYRY
jgi:iron complex outermembrane receptor protein